MTSLSKKCVLQFISNRMRISMNADRVAKRIKLHQMDKLNLLNVIAKNCFAL